MVRFLRRPVRSLPALLVVAAACSEQPVPTDPPAIPDDLLTTTLSVLDANNGGSPHFYFLEPVVRPPSGDFPGTADADARPVVQICPRNAAGDGCADGPPLASFSRDEGTEPDRVKIDGKDEFFLHWRMNTYVPETGGVYRIRVLLEGFELGHVDVVTLRQPDIAAFLTGSDGDVIPVSDDGELKIGFRIEEGALEGLLCDFDGDGDVQDCDLAVEIPGDGLATTVTVRTDGGAGDEIVARITAPDAVFEDANGTPIRVVLTAEVEVRPPSDDLLVHDDQELPYFVEVNTFPNDVFIDVAGPGVSVVVCQDSQELDDRGIPGNLHPQLILYKVGDNGVTRRLETVFGAPECEGHGAPEPSGVFGLLKRGAAKVLGTLGPQPLVARRRLHGGLNTTVTRDVTLDGPFSTFGAVLGPDAGQTETIVPDVAMVGVPVPITVRVRNALGEDFLFGGDTVKAEVMSGPDAGTVLDVVDEGGGLYTLTYTPTAPGVDEIRVLLTRSDGMALGPVSGSPFAVQVLAATVVSSAADAGPGTLRQVLASTNASPGLDEITFAIPGPGPHVIELLSPLPAVTDEAVVDGTSQPGYAGVPVVRVDGTSMAAGPVDGRGLAVEAGGVTVRGLAITSSPGDGIVVRAGATGAVLEDNVVGSHVAGAGGSGNAGAGIRVLASGTRVRDNVVVGNGGAGITVEGAATGVTLRGNAVSSNGGAGIDLGNDGVDANDPLDADGGPNGRVNAPVPGVSINGRIAGATKIQVFLDAAPGTSYEVEFFRSAACDASGSGEGAVPLLTAPAPTTDAQGRRAYFAIVAQVPPGEVVTATATDPSGSTSEFSVCSEVADLDVQNLFGSAVVAEAVGRFDEGDGTPDPSGTAFDLQTAQTFTVASAGTLAALRLPLANPGGGTEPLTVEVTGVAADGTPDGAPSFGTVTVPAGVLPAVFSTSLNPWVEVDLRSLGIVVSPGQVLAFQLRTADTAGYRFDADATAGYGGGAGYRRNAAVGPAWISTGRDYGFQVYVIP